MKYREINYIIGLHVSMKISYFPKCKKLFFFKMFFN